MKCKLLCLITQKGHKFELSLFCRYITVGCDAMKLILKNFGSVIKSNIDSPIQTVGVDISREERYTWKITYNFVYVTLTAPFSFLQT